MIILSFGLLLTKMELQLTANHCLQTVVDPDLVPILHASEIPTVIHGTYFENWTKIKTEGLSHMNRLHIHFSPGEPGDSPVVSGMRSSCQLYIYIDTEKALRGKSVSS
jgi:2'-phosphotransferase